MFRGLGHLIHQFLICLFRDQGPPERWIIVLHHGSRALAPMPWRCQELENKLEIGVDRDQGRECIENTMSKTTLCGKGHNARINNRSFSTYRFGLMSQWKSFCSNRLNYQINNNMKTLFFSWMRSKLFWERNRHRIWRSSDLDSSRGSTLWCFNYFLGIKGLEPPVRKLPYFPG